MQRVFWSQIPNYIPKTIKIEIKKKLLQQYNTTEQYNSIIKFSKNKKIIYFLVNLNLTDIPNFFWLFQ